MTILAIDTSTDYLSIAVMRGGKIVARFHRRSHMRHSTLLVPTIAKVLNNARMKLKDIDCFAISAGPGSFTGLRIGVTTVKGLAYSLDKPIVAVPTLEAIAYNAAGFDGVVCPVLDARKNKVYACLYRSDGEKIRKISKYLLIPAKELIEKTARYDKIAFLGDALHLVGKDAYGKKDWHPRADVVARLGAQYFAKEKTVTAERLEPMYLYSRECDIKGI